MTLKRQMKRIEKVVKDSPISEPIDEKVKRYEREVIEEYGLHGITKSEFMELVQLRLRHPKWPKMENQETYTDDQILSGLRCASYQFHDLDGFTDEELLTRYHGYFDKMFPHSVEQGE